MRRLIDRLAKLETAQSNAIGRSRILFGRDDDDLMAQRAEMVRSGRAADSDPFILVTWAGTMGGLMAHIAENDRKLHDHESGRPSGSSCSSSAPREPRERPVKR